MNCRLPRFIHFLFAGTFALAQIGSFADDASACQVRTASSEEQSVASIESVFQASQHPDFLDRYCVECHSEGDENGDVRLTEFADSSLQGDRDLFERVLRQLKTRRMPPLDSDRPDPAVYDAVVQHLTASLDKVAGQQPLPGRTETLRRLSRTEYQNVIRDLLHLEVDASDWLPADPESQGFDNVALGNLSPTLLNRYLDAARSISRLAMGGTEISVGGKTYRVAPDVTQEKHVDGLPIGTRGGILFEHTFPRDGIYEITILLARDRNETVEGLRGKHEVELLLDKKSLDRFTVQRPKDGVSYSKVDQHLKHKFKVEAGPHAIGVTFIKQPTSLEVTERQPFDAHFNHHRHPRLSPAIYQVSIVGPSVDSGPGETPSRKRVLVSTPAKETSDSEELAAKESLAVLLRRAYRRPVDEADFVLPLKFFREGCEERDFDHGMEMALAAVLVNPNFLFRVQRDPEVSADGLRDPYRIGDVELASRLSFFLWSSGPDDELLDLAEVGRLSNSSTLRQQVKRMLQDERAQSLVTSFANQWLYLRNLDSFTPDLRLFPDFDDNLRQAMRRETELFFESVVREDRSVLDLIQADDTFLNERLAKHYGVPNIYGSRFRRVRFLSDQPESSGSKRGGLLRHGSILSVTSYATRTSPVIRGYWILKNLLGIHLPPPPPDVPTLADNTVDATLPMRKRLAAHRDNPACAGCHNQMDPIGFSLENYDAVGRYREYDAGQPIDALGGLHDGSRFDGIDGLETAIVARPELFVSALTEKLLTYALGRAVTSADAAAVRKIVRDAARSDNRFSSLIQGIVQSQPFQMRSWEE